MKFRAHHFLACAILFAVGASLLAVACSSGEPAQDDIIEASRSGDLESVQALVSADPALLDTRDADGMTPLHWAIFRERHQVAAFLLEQGADFEAVDAENRTPLHHAAFGGDPSSVELLLASGADVMALEFRGRSPLFLATNWGNDLNVVEQLIAAGGDVNHVTRSGESVLLSTLYYGRPEIVTALVEAGARFPENDEQLGLVVFLAASNGFEDVFDVAVEELESRGIEWSNRVPLHAVARGGSVAIGERVLAAGRVINEENHYGITPLQIAAENGRLAFTEFLIRNGADLESSSIMGMTALHFARENGHDSVAASLLAAGATDAPAVFPELRGPYMGQPEPAGDTAEVFALGIVSGHSFENEHSPTAFSPDGTEAYWTQAFRGPINVSRLENGLWTRPEPAPFLSEHGEGEPIFSPDGQRLYFLSMRPIEPGAEPGKENIWYLEREGTGWSEPSPVSRAVNDFEQHWLHSVSEEGTLYFSSIREDGFGGRDLYRSAMVDGEHQTPENLGPVVNTETNEHTPFIAPDESYLIFASSAHGLPEGHGFHLVISYRQEDGGWSEPRSLAHVTAPARDPLCPMVTANGRFMFFIGSGDVWWTRAEFIEEMRG